MSLNIDLLTAIQAEKAGDALLNIERSFNIKLKSDDLKKVVSLDDLCDTICNEMKHSHAEGCTTQQAFYRFRNAFMAVSPCRKSEITPACRVKAIFPCENRAKMIEQLEAELGLKMNILQPKPWVTAVLAILFAGSLIACFFYGAVGAVGLILAAAGYKLSARFCNELNVKTVGDLVAKIVRDNHLKGRKGTPSVNRKHVEQKVRELFINQRQIESALA
ncbi:hypothetical protein [Mucilaginibacter antarcticus]|uniref:Uncharacterized protein n=1 Tax=Mucilaginibacter antarcticus TaxID=1855725 RepID=A0ABW5XL34_9SPHI